MIDWFLLLPGKRRLTTPLWSRNLIPTAIGKPNKGGLQPTDQSFLTNPAVLDYLSPAQSQQKNMDMLSPRFCVDLSLNIIEHPEKYKLIAK